MKSNLSIYTAQRFAEIVKESLESTPKQDVFVLMGIEDYLDISSFEDYIVDPETFKSGGGAKIFDEENWFESFFIALRKTRAYHVMSYAQFMYYTSYAPNLNKFKERVVIISDNIRSLYPIKAQEYIEKVGTENIEERPVGLPVYVAEQVIYEGKYYKSLVAPSGCKIVNFFDKSLPMDKSDAAYDEILELDEHLYTLDVFVNEAIKHPTKKKTLAIKRVKEILHADAFIHRLELANYLLSQIGSFSIIEAKESEIEEEYTPRKDTLDLLHRYWGESANFRNLKVYKNPGESSELVNISQGKIVDTILNECDTSINTLDNPNDIFVTAPTGSGKSLLFQLPAFYVSERGRVAIIVSPLIALMKDQVLAIQNDRGFKKVAYLNSELNLIDRNHIIDQCKAGEIDLLYMSPELFLSYDLSFFLGERELGLMVIDEAHLITTWGRDFRVDYWHLGNHIHKIRKYKRMRFPMVALTATAIYGGPNDMVVDSMGSLYMHNPYLFLGQVKRENIKFVINNYDTFLTGYKKNKTQQTIDIIRKLAEHKIKTVVYVPYTRHVNDIMKRVSDIAVQYYGSLSAEDKDYAYSQFKCNEKIIMVCTKAFGMGVDIPDIQVIYHHAPSGLLPDYVQEVGRVARNQEITGFAALDYNEKDKQYSQQLFGMSSIKQWQIHEVLKKIFNIYKSSGEHRNILVSSEDFSYIFNDGDPDGTKIKTALMMIEKDYLTKVRYNALIARPKQMFVKSYGRTNSYGLSVLETRYKGCFRKIASIGSDQTIVELDLDDIWQKDFSKMNFPLFKRDFYNGELLKDYQAHLVPLLKFSLTLNQDFQIVKENFFYLLDSLENAFKRIGWKIFTEEDFINALEAAYLDKRFRKKLAKYVLSAFSGQTMSSGKIEENPFLQKRIYDSSQYLLYNQSYQAVFSNMKRILIKMFGDTEKHTVNRFFSDENDYHLTYTRMGSLLELIGMATYECKGGDNPMIFIRLNDPDRIYRDGMNDGYTNELLRRTKKRHEISNEIFDHFFTNPFTSEDRWNFIEEFFLGATNEELFAKFPGNDSRNHIDIAEYISENVGEVSHDRLNIEEREYYINYPPREEEYYYKNSLLTIDVRTMNVINWINNDPIPFDIVRRKSKLKLLKDDLELLMSKIRTKNPKYYKESIGLDIRIEFPGIPKQVAASVPYSTDPVKFYRWWKKSENKDKVFLSKINLIKLLIKVDQIEPKAITAAHRKLLSSKI